MVVIHSLAVALLVSGGTTPVVWDDYPAVDSPVPAYGIAASARYVDDLPIVQDRIAEPWEPMTSRPRCGCDGIAVPEGW